MPICHSVSCSGLVPYREALAAQYDLVRRRQADEIPDTLLLLEHPPTVTLGRRADPSDLLTDRDDLARRGITVETVDRGGEITFHAPGQLVGYPILDLRAHGQDLHRYLRDLEEVLIQTLRVYGVTGERMPGLTGVWVQERKIAALGIKVSRWVSMHGFALNIDPDLSVFRQDIVPCGLRDYDVTSLAELLGAACPARAEIEPFLIAAFERVFGVSMRLTGSQAGIMTP